MIAALIGSYVDYVIFRGVTEKYPPWFEEELYEGIYVDESRYTFYVPLQERSPDYYEKTLVEDYSVFIRKPNGEVFVTDYDIFTDLYVVFKYDGFYNCGLAAFEEDCINYVECLGGVLPDNYPAWFYEYFTEALNFPQGDETIFFYRNGEVVLNDHSVVLRNRFAEIRVMTYREFLKYYDPEPKEDNI